MGCPPDESSRRRFVLSLSVNARSVLSRVKHIILLPQMCSETTKQFSESPAKNSPKTLKLPRIFLKKAGSDPGLSKILLKAKLNARPGRRSRPQLSSKRQVHVSVLRRPGQWGSPKNFMSKVLLHICAPTALT